jgi:hypothetical protein
MKIHIDLALALLNLIHKLVFALLKLSNMILAWTQAANQRKREATRPAPAPPAWFEPQRGAPLLTN